MLAVTPLVAVWNLSRAGDARSVNEKKVAALFSGAGLPKLTVMLPPTKAFVIGAEKMIVRTPVVPEPWVTSASLW